MGVPTATNDARDSLLERILGDEVPPQDEAAERMLAAALEQIEDFGVRRFTIDDLARRLGISRVTIYRRFAKKNRLLEAALLYELRRLLREIDASVESCETLEERLVEGFASSLLILRGHRLLSRLLRTEPELILPLLTIRGGPVIAASREFIASLARREAERDVTFDEEQLEVLSELLVRAVLSFLLTPQSVVSLDTPEEARRFARHYLTPVLQMMMADFKSKPAEFKSKPSTSRGGRVR
jgi:AcrR family transcriptional regulator